MKKTVLALGALMCVCSFNMNAQKKGAQKEAQPEGYKFTTVVSLPATPVKNQASTGTCWCFATTSFMESELLRKGKGEYDLSEMFIVRQKYMNQLNDNFLRRGHGNVGQGSLSHTWINAFKQVGIVPEQVYTGIAYDSPTHNHGELASVVQGIADMSVKMKKRSPQFNQIVDGVFDAYLGKLPEKFTYQGKEYTPKSFAASLDLNMDDYVEITSFSHKPFYQQMTIEVTDNWEGERQYNVPIDELIEVMDYALEHGYTLCWDGDVSEKGFSHANGVAINPQVQALEDYSTTDRARFEGLTAPQRLDAVYKFDRPYPEINVTQEIRQEGYESFVTTDDHLMHITGIVKDQNGTKYYITKNSWGTDRNTMGGYLNMSESYVRAKVIYVMLHKDAVPAALRQKLGF
ncbi:MAG: C1 family peptidase [Bacteroidales bacterium]|nr:C1 family peptidase [Bacteroidales bacterium]